MKKVILILLFVIATVCLAVVGCGGQPQGQSKDGIGSNVKFLHFVDKDGNVLKDYQLDQYFNSENLEKAIDEIEFQYYKAGEGKYLDGTGFSTEKDKINDYIINHEADCTVKKRVFLFNQDLPAYTVVLDKIPIEYKVTYEGLEDATFDGPGTYTVETEIPIPAPTRKYYVFLAWYEDGIDEGRKVKYIRQYYPKVPYDITLHAMWEPICFDLVFDGLAVGIPNPNQEKIYQRDGVYQLQPIESTVAYKFNGWKLNGLSVTSIDPVALWGPSSSIYDKDSYTLTLTADIEYFDFTVNYFVDDQLHSSQTLNFKNFKDFKDPPVPVKEHYTGRWSEKVTEYKNYDIVAVYDIDKFSIKVQTNISGYAVNEKEYEYGTTYKTVYDGLSYSGKKLMGLYLEDTLKTRVDEDALISAGVKLYAKWSDKYEISSPADWSLLKEHNDSYIAIANDIDFKGEAIPYIEQFSGILDGQNYTLSNFVNQNNSCPVTYGLFGTNKGKITNINFDGGLFVATTTPSASQMSVGFICGINSGTIENIQIADTTVKITCSHSTKPLGTSLVTVEGKVFAGVLAGVNRGKILYSTLSETLNVNLDTTMFALTEKNMNDNSIRVWATYGLIAGGNFGQIDHVTAASSLSSTASRTEDIPDFLSRYFAYVYFPLRVGGIVGSNEPEGIINDSLSSATVEVDHSVTAKRTFLGMLDIGGVSGVNSGKINNCIADNGAQINAYANAETKVGGISGTNAGDGVIKTSYSNASFTVGNRSSTEKTYWGGVVGLNEAAITYCYAVIDSMSINSFGNSETGNVGGLFGKGTAKSSALNSFVKIDSGVPYGGLSASALGTHDGATVVNCYAYLTAAANGFTVNGGITKCDTEADLLTNIKHGYENMGFTISKNGYPILPNVGDQ